KTTGQGASSFLWYVGGGGEGGGGGGAAGVRVEGGGGGRGGGGGGLAAGQAVVRVVGDKKLLGPFTLGVAIVVPLGEDVDFFPRVHANVVNDQLVGNRVPAHPVRVAEAVRVDFLF